MTFKIIEQLTVGKRDDPSLCEDVVYASPGFYGIIDGSSIGAPVDGKPSGRLIAETTAAGLQDLQPDMDMPTAIRTLNRRVRQAFGYASSDEVMARGARPAASCAFLSVARDEIWAVGDTMLLLDGVEVDLTKAVDHATTQARCMRVMQLLGEGVSAETIVNEAPDFAFIKPLLDGQQVHFLNRADQKDFGYANIDGADEVIPLIRVIALNGAQEIVMASDGYTTLLPTLAASEQELARVIAAEPTLHSLSPQVKGMRPNQVSFDDRAYLRLLRL